MCLSSCLCMKKDTSKLVLAMQEVMSEMEKQMSTDSLGGAAQCVASSEDWEQMYWNLVKSNSWTAL